MSEYEDALRVIKRHIKQAQKQQAREERNAYWLGLWQELTGPKYGTLSAIILMTLIGLVLWHFGLSGGTYRMLDALGQ